MKRYVFASEEIKLPIYNRYTTKRGNIYDYRITTDGSVVVWETYCTMSTSQIKKRILKNIPKEMQNYLKDTYAEPLSRRGITLNF